MHQKTESKSRFAWSTIEGYFVDHTSNPTRTKTVRLLVDHDTLWVCPEDNCAVVGPVGNAVIPFNAVGVGFDEPILVTTGAEVVVTGAPKRLELWNIDRWNAIIAEVQMQPPKQTDLPEVLQRLVG